MPLQTDTEFQRELDSIKSSVTRRNRNTTQLILFLMSTILLTLGWFLIENDFSTSTCIVVMIAASTICMAYLIERGFNALRATQVITLGVIEWIGRKQLGEYEKSE